MAVEVVGSGTFSVDLKMEFIVFSHGRTVRGEKGRSQEDFRVWGLTTWKGTAGNN